MSSRAFALAFLVLAVTAAGCATQPPTKSAASAARDVAPTGNVRAWDLWLAGGSDLDVGGRHPFTLRFTTEEGGLGSVPGPEIRVKQGDTVRVTLHGGHHTMHWHGVRLPWGMDGVPGVTQAIGDGAFTYEFVAKDAGTFWYHCHVAAPMHIDWGMFGAFIVEPSDASVDPPFDHEATLFLHEMDTRSYALADFVGGAVFEGSTTPQTLTNAPPNAVDLTTHIHENAATTSDIAKGFAADSAGVDGGSPRGYHPRYDLFMINGKTFPDTAPVHINVSETVRIRIINAGQLVHTMHLHGHRFLVAHKDGALLPAPYLADTIGLFPGERYDIYVTGDNPGMWDFHDHGGSWGVGGYATDDGVFPGGMATMLVYDDWTMPEHLAAPS